RLDVFFAQIVVLTRHLFMNDWVPGRFPVFRRHVVLARPAPQAQLFDEIHVPQYATSHKPSLVSQNRSSESDEHKSISVTATEATSNLLVLGDPRRRMFPTKKR